MRPSNLVQDSSGTGIYTIMKTLADGLHTYSVYFLQMLMRSKIGVRLMYTGIVP